MTKYQHDCKMIQSSEKACKLNKKNQSQDNTDDSSDGGIWVDILIGLIIVTIIGFIIYNVWDRKVKR